MGAHHIHISVTGSTEFVKKVANETVSKLKTAATVTGAAITHGSEEVLDGTLNAVGEASDHR